MLNDEHYRVTQVKPNLWAIEDIKSTEHSIIYLLCGQSKALLFDTGLGLSPVSPIVKELTKLPLIVVLSHWHFDHVGGAYEFNNVIGWKSDAMINACKNGINLNAMNKQFDTAFWESIGHNLLQINSFSSIQLLDKEGVIDLGGYSIKLLHTPGHTYDSICLYEPKQGWLFTGDSVYPGPIYLQFEDSDIAAYQRSIVTLEKLDVTSILPGHNAILSSASLMTEIRKLLKSPSYKSQKFPNLSINMKNSSR